LLVVNITPSPAHWMFYYHTLRRACQLSASHSVHALHFNEHKLLSYLVQSNGATS